MNHDEMAKELDDRIHELTEENKSLTGEIKRLQFLLTMEESASIYQEVDYLAEKLLIAMTSNSGFCDSPWKQLVKEAFKGARVFNAEISQSREEYRKVVKDKNPFITGGSND